MTTIAIKCKDCNKQLGFLDNDSLKSEYETNKFSFLCKECREHRNSFDNVIKDMSAVIAGDPGTKDIFVHVMSYDSECSRRMLIKFPYEAMWKIPEGDETPVEEVKGALAVETNPYFKICQKCNRKTTLRYGVLFNNIQSYVCINCYNDYMHLINRTKKVIKEYDKLEEEKNEKNIM